MTTLNLEAMSVSEMAALQKQLQDAKKAATDAQNARYAEKGRDLVETVLLERGVEASEFSERVGVSTQSLPIEIDGRQYTYYVSIRDVSATEVRKAAIDAGQITVKTRARDKDKDKS